MDKKVSWIRNVFVLKKIEQFVTDAQYLNVTKKTYNNQT